MMAPVLTSAHGEALTLGECGVLRQQRTVLVQKGVGKHLSKGAKWASDNLNATQLSEVGTFLELSENIRFRCGKNQVNRKNKAKLDYAVPIPVRNSRRPKKIKAEKDSGEKVPLVVETIAPETKSVISAVTNEKKNIENATTAPSYRPPAK